MPRKRKRKAKPNPEPYIRRILGIPIGKIHLSEHEMYRLDFATALIGFVAKNAPDMFEMAAFIKRYMGENPVSKQFCYKTKKKLEKLTIIGRFRDPFDFKKKYKLNMERWRRDKSALDSFKSQVRAWENHQSQ